MTDSENLHFLRKKGGCEDTRKPKHGYEVKQA
jgi:hypothetical protein